MEFGLALNTRHMSKVIMCMFALTATHDYSLLFQHRVTWLVLLILVSHTKKGKKYNIGISLGFCSSCIKNRVSREGQMEKGMKWLKNLTAGPMCKVLLRGYCILKGVPLKQLY